MKLVLRGGVIISKLRFIANSYKNNEDIKDYKFYCFNGVPKVLMIASNRFTTHNFDYYDMDFHKIPITSSAGKIPIRSLRNLCCLRK